MLGAWQASAGALLLCSMALGRVSSGSGERSTADSSANVNATARRRAAWALPQSSMKFRRTKLAARGAHLSEPLVLQRGGGGDAVRRVEHQHGQQQV